MKQSAYEAAVGLLSRRDHSEKELRTKLLNKGLDFDDVQAAIQLCLSYGYLDDGRYTEMMIRNGLTKGWGPMRIQQELKHKGISEHRVNLVLAESDIDWFEQAKETAQRKFGRKGALPTEHQAKMKEKARRFRFLQYRGFSVEQTNYALESIVFSL